MRAEENRSLRSALHLRLSSQLLDWYRLHGRDLPWRHTRDPYAIWLSEVILQQTRVSQGLAYWQRFMEAYPTVQGLAAATEDEVLRLWQGLGYYSRARNLHAAARQVVALGRFPDTLEGIRKLKGVGDYTAASVAAFAFGLPAVAMDGNAYRVLARLHGIGTPIDTTEGKKEFRLVARDIERQSLDFRVFNSALMDFGATLCTPQSPGCGACPLVEDCVALREHRVGALPVKRRKAKVSERHFVYVYVRCQGMTALHRRGAGDIWQGLWEPPLLSHAPSGAIPVVEGMRHVLTHQVIHADLYLLVADSRPPLPDGYVWVAEDAVARYAVPRLVERMLSAIPRAASAGSSPVARG